MESVITGKTLKLQSDTTRTDSLNHEVLLNKPSNYTDDGIATGNTPMDLKHASLTKKFNEKNKRDENLKCNLKRAEKDYECLKKKYDSLMEKYKEQKDKIESLSFHNDKLLSMVFSRKLEKAGEYRI